MMLQKFLFFLFISSLSFAALQSTTQNSSAASSALGGSGIAAVTAGDVSTVNPSTLVYLYGFNFYSKYAPGETAYSISDNSMETVIPAAVYYYQRKDFKLFKLTFAEQFTQRLSLGFNANFYQQMINNINMSQTGLDLGVTYISKSNFGIAATIYDIGKSSDLWPEEKRLEPRVGVGLHYVYKGFLRWRGDFVTGNKFNYKQGAFMSGFEDYISRWVVLRVGYQKNLSDISDLYTLGAGFDLPKFKINYAYLSETIDNPEVRHSVDLTIPFG